MLTELLAATLGLGSLVTLAALASPRRQIETTLTLPASPDLVWQVLTEGAAYPDWNPFIRRMSGRFAPGERLTTRMHPQGGRPMTFRPRVLVADRGRELRWLGRLGLPRLFDGEHYFRLEAAPTGTRLVHGENFRGVLLWLMSVDRFQTDFAAMNQALHDRVRLVQASAGREERFSPQPSDRG